MNQPHVLVLHGPPGSGKSTLADEIAELLLDHELSHAVIDVDELNRTFPEAGTAFTWKNLAAIWPQYMTFPKVILPVLLDTPEDFKALRTAVKGSRITVCALTAGEATLKRRVTDREPNEYWKSKLRSLVDKYVQHNKMASVATITAVTENRSIRETASGILSKLDWLTESRLR